MSEIYYPTLDQFVYQLGEGLGADTDNVEENQKEFLKNFPDPELQKKVKQTLNDNCYPKSAKFTFLLSQPNYYPIAPEHYQNYLVEQFYQPVISSDIYGLLYDCSIIPDCEKQPIEGFQTLKKLADCTQGNLGKTCLLSGYYPPESNPQYLASKIFKEIRNNQTIPEKLIWEWQQHSPGKFLGGDVFWVQSLYPTEKSSTENRAILIILYPHSSLNENFQHLVGNFNQYWLELFSYQNKIIWAYEKSLLLKRELETWFLEIRNTLAKIKQLPRPQKGELDLEKIKSIIKESSGIITDYAINLSYLKIQLSTIETNLQNHRLLLDYIVTQAKPYGETNLDCIKSFNKTVNNRYIKQVQQDYASLSPGLEALENLLNPIKSLVELEEGERDRRLENLIAAAGVGVGTASAAASSIANFVKEIREPQIIQKPAEPLTPPAPPSPWSNFWFAFFFSILIGAAFGIGTWLLLAFFRSWRYYRHPV